MDTRPDVPPTSVAPDGLPAGGPDAGQLHILTPAGRASIDALIEAGIAVVGDLLADLGSFPPALYCVSDGEPAPTASDVTADVAPPRDYWAVARHWLEHVTAVTGLQDSMEVDGYGLWWTLNGQRFIPAISQMGNAFAWIDLLAGARRSHGFRRITVHGDHAAILHVIRQIHPDAKVVVCTDAKRTRRRLPSPRMIALLGARALMSTAYLLYSLVRRPQVIFFSSTTLLRPAAGSDPDTLRDVYLGDVARALRARGWQTAFVEKLGPNASWRGFLARGFFFPNDLVFALALPALHRWTPLRRILRQWRERWKGIQPTLTPHLTYNGCDLAPLLMPRIAREFEQHAPNIEIMVRIWRRILKLWQPRLLYINNSYGRSAVPAIIAARGLGILTIEQQHGVMNRDHLPYLLPRSAGTATEFPLCDVMVVWGDYFRRLLVNAGTYQADEIAVCGFPRIDSLLGSLPSQASTLSHLDIPHRQQPAPHVVLYTSNEIAADLMPDILDGIATCNSPDLYWIIKLHPRERTRDAWSAAIAARGLDRVRIVEREPDFYALLAACDIHVSFTSTTLVEAAILGKVNLGLEIPRMPDPVGYAEANAYLPVAPRQLGPVAEQVLNDAALRERLAREQRAFARDWCVHDGRAVERIVRLVERSIHEKEAPDAGP